MNRIAILAAALLAAPVAAPASDPALTPAEREMLVDLLDDGRDRLLAAVASLDDEAWNYKAAPDRWSPAEIVEHLYKSEGLFGGTLEQALAGKADPEWKTKTGARTGQLKAMMVDRSQKAQAPEPLKPGGEMSRAELVNGFAKARAGAIAMVKTTDKPLKQYVVPFGPLGEVNAMQVLVLRGAHTLRHFAQLEEAMAGEGFPK